VTKVSPTGLFAGKPLLPGDVILSINGISFRDQPNVKTALILMDNAKKEIRIQVLHAATNDNAFQSKRRLWNPELFFGTRRFNSSRNCDKSKCWKGFSRGGTSKSPPRKRAETHTTPDTSFDEGYC
jgi:hypothetical protein